MENPSKILRRSIFSFLQNYQYFTTTSAFLAFPFAASILLLQSLVPSSLIRTRIHSLFDALVFPYSSSLFFSVLNTKLSQTISISILAFPFTISFFLLSKASVIHGLMTNNPKNPSFSCHYPPLIHTQICNSLFTLSANATCFSLLLIAFNLDLFSPGFVLVFAIIVANTFIICNLALIISATHKIRGLSAIIKACIMIKGRAETALILALPTNSALAALETLFHYRVVRPYYHEAKTGIFLVALEGLFIAYLYALLLVLDTIVAYFFVTRCQLVEDTAEIDEHQKIVEYLPYNVG